MIWALITGSKTGRYVTGALVAVTLAGAGVAWIRWDAVRDDRAEQEAAAKAARIEHMKGAKDVETQIENMGADGFDAAIDSMPGRNDATGTIR